jgi:cytochrome c551/c552
MTSNIARTLITSLTLSSLSLSAQAVSNGVTSGMGHDLAQTLCSSCHLIEPGQKNPPDHVGGPSFQAVADRPNITAAKLRDHLKNTHTNAIIPLSMPNPALSQDELNKIIDYILSMKNTTRP